MWVVICLIVYILVETGKICFFFIYNRKSNGSVIPVNKTVVPEKVSVHENRIYKKTREIRKAGE